MINPKVSFLCRSRYADFSHLGRMPRIFQFGCQLAMIGSCLLRPSTLLAQSGAVGGATGLQINATVDILGKLGDAGPARSERLDVREAEVLLYGPADTLFEGMLNLAAHQESDGAFFEVHEAYVGSSRLLPRSRFKLGQYFLGIGRLNQIHRHDWPFVTAPSYHRRFFDAEGVADSGVEFGSLLPLPFFLDLTAGVTSGWKFGHSHSDGDRPLFPTHYLRLINYIDLPADGGLAWGLNYLGRKDHTGIWTTLLGIDFTAKWREGARLTVLLQSEIWARLQRQDSASAQNELGAYIFAQYGISSQWYLGIRADTYSNLELSDALGRKIANAQWAASAQLTFRASEFSVIRLGMNSEIDTQGDNPALAKWSGEIQSIFYLGAHPAHDF